MGAVLHSQLTAWLFNASHFVSNRQHHVHYCLLMAADAVYMLTFALPLMLAKQSH